ncbi:MAG: hypothetical protein KBT28_09225 [Bacteroidales bacterium]|nr:hypothetical protein [Candidatus Colimorpha merdihippi]
MMKIKLLQPIPGLHNFCAKIQKTIDIAKFILLIALVARWLLAIVFGGRLPQPWLAPFDAFACRRPVGEGE